MNPDVLGLRCSGCGKYYPVIAGIPVLVSEPAAYLRSELALLTRALHDARQRRSLLVRMGGDAGLLNVSLDRHRDVTDVEIAQAKTFLALLEPAEKALAALTGSASDAADSLGVRRSGWSFDMMLPYLLRDWSYTSEFEAANSMIGATLKQVLPDPSKKSIAVAGCGAGGLLAGLSLDFEKVLGFDLTLPILAAARQLLDGKSLELALPRYKLGRISLRRREPISASPHIELIAIDALETAFADGAIDCVITMFLLDCISDARSLAGEIYRILSDSGVWINYGPSGAHESLWHFDQTESAAFFEAAGFTVMRADAHRATYLDLSRDNPLSSFHNHMCYLTAGRKTGKGWGKPRVATLSLAALAEIIPQHFPGAHLVQQQSLGTQQTRMRLHHERILGRVDGLEIGRDTARIMALVDGKRNVREIADLIKQRNPAQAVEETIRAFARYFHQGLLSWRE